MECIEIRLEFPDRSTFNTECYFLIGRWQPDLFENTTVASIITPTSKIYLDFGIFSSHRNQLMTVIIMWPEFESFVDYQISVGTLAEISGCINGGYKKPKDPKIEFPPAPAGSSVSHSRATTSALSHFMIFGSLMTLDIWYASPRWNLPRCWKPFTSSRINQMQRNFMSFIRTYTEISMHCLYLCGCRIQNCADFIVLLITCVEQTGKYSE